MHRMKTSLDETPSSAQQRCRPAALAGASALPINQPVARLIEPGVPGSKTPATPPPGPCTTSARPSHRCREGHAPLRTGTSGNARRPLHHFHEAPSPMLHGPTTHSRRLPHTTHRPPPHRPTAPAYSPHGPRNRAGRRYQIQNPPSSARKTKSASCSSLDSRL